jgi:hypothetical protein
MVAWAILAADLIAVVDFAIRAHTINPRPLNFSSAGVNLTEDDKSLLCSAVLLWSIEVPLLQSVPIFVGGDFNHGPADHRLLVALLLIETNQN